MLEGLEAAWAFFGGVVRRLVADNLKPVVTRPDRYDPHLNRVFLEYAQYRGFVLDPAVPAHPTGKPKVERGVPYARQDYFRGESFRDVAEMQTRAVTWARDIAGTRVHGTTRQVPRVVFESIEQPTLLPLAPEPSDRPRWAWATVHPDHHIKFGHALYSVPTRYLGKRVEVRGDSRLVRSLDAREKRQGDACQKRSTGPVGVPKVELRPRLSRPTAERQHGPHALGPCPDRRQVRAGVGLVHPEREGQLAARDRRQEPLPLRLGPVTKQEGAALPSGEAGSSSEYCLRRQDQQNRLAIGRGAGQNALA